MTDKERMVQVTDATEIESIRRNDHEDIIGTIEPDGTAWAYAWSVEAWRKQPNEAPQ